MRVFLNEFSLSGQYHTAQSFEAALQTACSMLFVLTRPHFRDRGDSFLSSILQSRSGPATLFVQHLNSVRDRSIRTRFFALLDQLAAKKWQDQMVQSVDEVYAWEGEIVTDTSMAELAERELQGPDPLPALLNFRDGILSGRASALIRKENGDSTEPLCFEDAGLLSETISRRLGLDQSQYPEDAAYPPFDVQTVLADATRFEPTPLRVKGRKVYREIVTGRFFHVDSLHVRDAAGVTAIPPSDDGLVERLLFSLDAVFDEGIPLAV